MRKIYDFLIDILSNCEFKKNLLSGLDFYSVFLSFYLSFVYWFIYSGMLLIISIRIYKFLRFYKFSIQIFYFTRPNVIIFLVI